MSIEAMKQAIEAINEAVAFREGGRQKAIDAINALRTAIQQAESEPVGAREALERIASWSEHPAMLGVDYGSNGVRDYYRKIARDALTHPAPGVPDDVVRDAERYLWLRSAMKNGGSKGPYDERLRTMLHKDGTGRTMFQFYFWCRPEQLDSSIDAAMLAAK